MQKATDYVNLGILAGILILVFTQCCENFYSEYDISHDNPIEEFIEEVIEAKTGVEVDLTPTSKES